GSNLPLVLTAEKGKGPCLCGDGYRRSHCPSRRNPSMMKAGKPFLTRKHSRKARMLTIGSGLPHSCTALSVQVLVAGGIKPVTDGERKADTDNPRGYLEWERIKQLPKDPSLIAEGEGKVVKVISQLLLSLPDRHEYRIVFMQRPLPEVLKSQEEML